MSERIDEGIIKGAVDYITVKQTQKILMQMEKSICKIKGKLTGTGFFCLIKYENKDIPCLMTNYYVLDKEYIKKNIKIVISMNVNAINKEITINEQDIIYQSKKDEYDLIIIRLKQDQDYMKNINYLELDENLLHINSKKGYESIYILHYPNAQNASVSYGKGIIFDEENKYDIKHRCNTSSGSSGGPILNLLTNKVIGIHKGCIQKNGEVKYNIGTFLKEPLEEKKNNKINNQIINVNLYNNFNIELKEPIHILNYHTRWVTSLTIMNDGRLVSGSAGGSIIIYNKETYKPDLLIKEHNARVNYITQLSSGILASCSSDNSIKLFKIKGNEYEVLQTLKDHTSYVNTIIELKNKTLVSCSIDESIIFYIKDNLEYKKDYQISKIEKCWNIIQTKDNEICYNEGNHTICFYDLLQRKVKASISNVSTRNMIMITNNLLFITGSYKISIINVNNYKLRIIDIPESSCIFGVCLLNQNVLLTGDCSNIISQWIIEDDNLILVSKKKNAHDRGINDLLNLGNGHIASYSGDKTIKIW